MSDFLKKVLLSFAIAVSLTVVSAVCWHSLEEIHYLKSFYPSSFTVEQAFYASGVELIKVTIIALPFLLAIGVCLYLLRISRKRDE